MVRLVLAISFLFTIFCSVWADMSVTTDADLCTDILTKSLENMLKDITIDNDRPIQLRYGDGYRLTNSTRTGIEALLTGLGFSISNSFNKSGYICEIAVTDCSIILRDIDSAYARTVMLSVHLKYTDSNGTLLFASGKREIASDTILSKKMLKKTDNGYMFSREATRVFITKNRSQLKILSLTALIAILAYFASQ